MSLEDVYNTALNYPFNDDRIDVVGQNGNEGSHYDDVTNPKHYQLIPEKNVQVIDTIRASLSTEEFRGYCKGNIIKYSHRAGSKFNEPATKDIKKIRQYCDYYLEET